MLVRVGPQVQAVLRIGSYVTGGFDTGDQTVNLALRRLAEADPEMAMQAEAAYGSLTWGNGLPAVSLRGLPVVSAARQMGHQRRGTPRHRARARRAVSAGESAPVRRAVHRPNHR